MRTCPVCLQEVAEPLCPKDGTVLDPDFLLPDDDLDSNPHALKRAVPVFCPECKDEQDGRFCANCAYDFIEQKSMLECRCPDCGCGRDTGVLHCELCNYDFIDRRSGKLQGLNSAVSHTVQAATAVSLVEPQLAVKPAETEANEAEPLHEQHEGSDDEACAYDDRIIWAVVTADRDVYDQVSANLEERRKKDPAIAELQPFPEDAPARHFLIDIGSRVISRQSREMSIRAHIEVMDPAVSRPHAVLMRRPDGNLSVVDDSTHGTRLNQWWQKLEPNAETPLRVGDRLMLGAWTSIHITDDAAMLNVGKDKEYAS